LYKQSESDQLVSSVGVDTKFDKSSVILRSSQHSLLIGLLLALRT